MDSIDDSSSLEVNRPPRVMPNPQPVLPPASESSESISASISSGSPAVHEDLVPVEGPSSMPMRSSGAAATKASANNDSPVSEDGLSLDPNSIDVSTSSDEDGRPKRRLLAPPPSESESSGSLSLLQSVGCSEVHDDLFPIEAPFIPVRPSRPSVSATTASLASNEALLSPDGQGSIGGTSLDPNGSDVSTPSDEDGRPKRRLLAPPPSPCVSVGSIVISTTVGRSSKYERESPIEPPSLYDDPTEVESIPSTQPSTASPPTSEIMLSPEEPVTTEGPSLNSKSIEKSTPSDGDGCPVPEGNPKSPTTNLSTSSSSVVGLSELLSSVRSFGALFYPGGNPPTVAPRIATPASSTVTYSSPQQTTDSESSIGYDRIEVWSPGCDDGQSERIPLSESSSVCISDVSVDVLPPVIPSEAVEMLETAFIAEMPSTSATTGTTTVTDLTPARAESLSDVPPSTEGPSLDTDNKHRLTVVAEVIAVQPHTPMDEDDIPYIDDCSSASVSIGETAPPPAPLPNIAGPSSSTPDELKAAPYPAHFGQPVRPECIVLPPGVDPARMFHNYDSSFESTPRAGGRSGIEVEAEMAFPPATRRLRSQIDTDSDSE